MVRLKKKITIYLAKLENTGGIESHIFEFLEAFKSTDIQIHLVVSDMQMEAENIDRLKKLCYNLSYPRSNNKFIRLAWFFIVCIRMRILHINALYSNGQGESFWFFAKCCNFDRWVHHHHTSGDLYDQSTWGENYKLVLKNADVIIACSLKNAKDIQKAIQRDIETIPCFSRKINLIKNDKIKETHLKFGYYGRLIPEKGIDTLIRLSQDVEIENIEFHIWGKGWAYEEKNFENLNRLIYHGSFNSKSELEYIVNFIDAFLLLSRHPEGLPISLLEVMSAGVPWLATNVGGISDIACDPNSTRLLSLDSNYEQIKAAVIMMANDIRNEKITSDNQVRLYKSKFDADVLVLRWRELFNV